MPYDENGEWYEDRSFRPVSPQDLGMSRPAPDESPEPDLPYQQEEFLPVSPQDLGMPRPNVPPVPRSPYQQEESGFGPPTPGMVINPYGLPAVSPGQAEWDQNRAAAANRAEFDRNGPHLSEEWLPDRVAASMTPAQRDERTQFLLGRGHTQDPYYGTPLRADEEAYRAQAYAQPRGAGAVSGTPRSVGGINPGFREFRGAYEVPGQAGHVEVPRTSPHPPGTFNPANEANFEGGRRNPIVDAPGDAQVAVLQQRLDGLMLRPEERQQFEGLNQAAARIRGEFNRGEIRGDEATTMLNRINELRSQFEGRVREIPRTTHELENARLHAQAAQAQIIASVNAQHSAGGLAGRVVTLPNGMQMIENGPGHPPTVLTDPAIRQQQNNVALANHFERMQTHFLDQLTRKNDDPAQTPPAQRRTPRQLMTEANSLASESREMMDLSLNPDNVDNRFHPQNAARFGGDPGTRRSVVALPAILPENRANPATPEAVARARELRSILEGVRPSNPGFWNMTGPSGLNPSEQKRVQDRVERLQRILTDPIRENRDLTDGDIWDYQNIQREIATEIPQLGRILSLTPTPEQEAWRGADLRRITALRDEAWRIRNEEMGYWGRFSNAPVARLYRQLEEAVSRGTPFNSAQTAEYMRLLRALEAQGAEGAGLAERLRLHR